MPTLFRFLFVVGLIAGVVTGSLYVLAEYFQPVPKPISKSLRNVKVREKAGTEPQAGSGTGAAPAGTNPGTTTGSPAAAPSASSADAGATGSTSQRADRAP